MAGRAFVTGGTGFLGRNLIEQLCAAGWQVCALHRPGADTAALDGRDIEPVAGDLLELAGLRLPGGLDAVFHVAGDISTWSRQAARQTRVNVEGTRNMVAAALAAGARRFVHTSTWNVYGLAQGAISEASPKQGRQSWITYDRTKALAEEEVLAGAGRGLDAVIMNPAHVIGRYDRHGWSRMIRLTHQDRLPGVPPGAGSFAHAEEVARAHIAAAERGRTGENYLLGGTDATFMEVFQAIGDVTARPIPKRPLAPWAVRTVAHVLNGWSMLTGRPPDLTPQGAAIVCASARIVSDRAMRELDYRAVPLPVMLRDCYDWLAAEGLLNG